MAAKRILLVDDEPRILDVVRAYLEKEGFQVDAAASGREAIEKSAHIAPDLIVLDLMLPDVAGEELCLRLRHRSDVPILMLTAKTQADEIVQGLAVGADDYVTKPFAPKELVARVWALLRRAAGPTAPLVDTLSFNSGTLVLHSRRQQALLHGMPLTLTRSEWSLLVLLARNPGRVWSRDDLITRLRGFDYHGDDRTIDAHVKKLRAKVEENPRNPRFVLTVWGTGYKFGGVPDV